MDEGWNTTGIRELITKFSMDLALGENGELIQYWVGEARRRMGG